MKPSNGTLTAVGSVVFTAALYLSPILPHAGINEAAAQENSVDPDDLRDLAENREDKVKNLRRNPASIATVLLSPFLTTRFLQPRLTSQDTSKATKQMNNAIKVAVHRMRIHAPAEAAEAASASMALIRAFQHQADAYEALAKKLRQEADRLEREQKKKN